MTETRLSVGVLDRYGPKRRAATPGTRPEISIVVPTRNEAGNVDSLVAAVVAALRPSGRRWELIFVDDSDDDTPEVISRAAERTKGVALIHRSGRQRRGGLAGAVRAGYTAAAGDAIVVMDGDLQHPPELVRGLAAPILAGQADLVVASRYVTGASAAGLDSRWRRFVSTVCTMVVHLLVPASREIRDPLSGFFAVSRQRIDGVDLRPHGFKILLEVVVRAHPQNVMEVPFTMRERAEGDSKAGLGEGLRFCRHIARLARPGRAELGRLLVRLLAQLPLAAILAVQTWLSVNLIYRNTAFIDEATYLGAGHYEIYTWSHSHAANLELPTYFSGAPTIYPIIAAWADGIGGLAGARSLSMAFMIVATLAIFSSAKRLWGRPAGWLAAGLWVTTQGVQFLGSFATYDAMALMLITVAAWVVVRAAARDRLSGLIYLAAPVLILANATKYASALYDPVVIAVAFFVIGAYHGWSAARRVALTMAALLVIGITAALALAPSSYLAGIDSTTLKRAPSTATVAKVLDTSWSWIGVIAVVAAVAAVIALSRAGAARGRLSTPVDRRRTVAVVGLLLVGAVAVWLAPLEQARIHTETSLSKHVTFGAWFAALAAGWLFSKLVARDRPNPWWRYGLAGLAMVVTTALLIPVGIAGEHQADHLDNEWSNSNQIISVLRPLVAHNDMPILMDESEIPAYYLESEANLPRWVNTFYYAYTPPGSTTSLTGPAAYTAAVDNGVFSVIALDYGTQITVDRAVAAAIHDSGRYRWVGNYTSPDDFGPDTYVVWTLRS